MREIDARATNERVLPLVLLGEVYFEKLERELRNNNLEGEVEVEEKKQPTIHYSGYCRGEISTALSNMNP